MVTDLFNKWRDTQTAKQNTLDKHHTMMPLINEEGKIVDYSIHMNHVLLEQILKQELAFDEVKQIAENSYTQARCQFTETSPIYRL